MATVVDEAHDRAKARLREEKQNKAARGDSGGATPTGTATETGDGEVRFFRNFDEVEHVEANKSKIIQVSITLSEMQRRLFDITQNWPKRFITPGQGGRGQLFADDGGAPFWIDSGEQLIAWIARFLPKTGNHGVQFRGGHDKANVNHFLAHLQQSAEGFLSVESFPHCPPMPDHYYLHPDVKGGDGAALERLMVEFKPNSPEDRELILSFLVTLIWGGSVGQRPLFLFMAPEGDEKGGRGIGKSTVPQVAADLVGGLVDTDARDDFAALKTRLLSPGAQNKRLILLDNVKTLRFSSEDIEKLITSTTISGKRLFHGEGSRPNTFTVAMTINGPSLSKDIAQRTIPIVLGRPAFSATWRRDVNAMIDRERWEILGDLVAFFKRTPAEIAPTRWGEWEGDVLARLVNPKRLQELIADRQSAADSDEDDMESIRELLAKALTDHGYQCTVGPYFLSTKDLAEVLKGYWEDKIPLNKVTPRLRALAIPELRAGKHCGVRGWIWTGPEGDPRGRPTVADLRGMPS